MVEREDEQLLSEEIPPAVTHQVDRGEKDVEEVEFTRDKVLDFVTHVQENPSRYTAHFELDLNRSGLLTDLEETGILPRKDPKADAESSSEDIQYESLVDERDEILKHIYIGTVLAHLFNKLFPNK